VHRCADAFLRTGAPLHGLINNAGVAMRGLTPSGFEINFGTNHVGHFLLTQLLVDHIRDSAPARIVTVASRAHFRAKTWDWDALQKPTRTIAGMKEYSASKLANVWFSAELARRLVDTGVSTYSLHPGVVASELWRRVPQPIRWLITRRMISNEQGALTTLHCATSPRAASETGLYYDDCAPRRPSKLAQDENLARELWERTDQWVKA
jgi:NAD(P)-dependent dehydrogenase (short-subunit alcohol dehydrogenase family)